MITRISVVVMTTTMHRTLMIRVVSVMIERILNSSDNDKVKTETNSSSDNHKGISKR